MWYFQTIRRHVTQYYDKIKKNKTRIVNNVLSAIRAKEYQLTINSHEHGLQPVEDRESRRQLIRQSFIDILFVDEQRSMIVEENIATITQLNSWRNQFRNEVVRRVYHKDGTIDYDPHNFHLHSGDGDPTAWFAQLILTRLQQYHGDANSEVERNHIIEQIYREIEQNGYWDDKRLIKRIRMDVSNVSNVIRGKRSRRSGEGNEEMQQTRTQPRIRSEAEEACELHDRTGNEEQKNEEDGEEEEQEEGIDEDVNGKAIYFR